MKATDNVQPPNTLEGSPSIPWTIRRVRQEHVESLEERVALEEPLEIVVNGQSIAVLMRLPGQEKELAAGFCITEGYVRAVTDILLIHHCGSGLPAPGEESRDMESRNRVTLRVTSGGFAPPDRPDVVRLIRSGCGAADVTALSEELPRVNHDVRASATVLLGLGRAMRDQQDVHRSVGGTHAAVLFDTAGRAITLAEDIGRHNAMDKAIGYCLLRGIPLHDKVLLTSGRASYEMASKAVRVGIPIVASVSAPTSLAVQLAEDRGLTLIGYLRGGRMNVYTHPERIANAGT
jgi:FdhD protein